MVNYIEHFSGIALSSVDVQNKNFPKDRYFGLYFLGLGFKVSLLYLS
jgi:hypothetical protein